MSEDLKPDHLEVVEEKDGSASVELPDNVDNPQIEARDAQDADGDVDHPDDTDAQREARRNRRRAKKDYIKRTNEEKDSRLTNLQRQNQELMERLAVVERKSYASDLARLDKAMEGFKQRAVSAGDKEEGAANPQLVRQANRWMERNSWYDPKGGDEDSQIAKVIDNRLAEEGYDPASSDYWEELDSRLQKRLPHLYNQRSESNRSRPRSVVTGTGRETGRASGGNTFVLEPEQVRAMKDAGLWDDPEKRARMIKRYAAEAKLNRNA